MRTLFLLCAIMLGCNYLSWGQNLHNQINSFEFIRRIKGAQGVRNQIEFWDSLTNNKIKTINLIEFNPFKNISGKIIGIHPDFETPIYAYIDTLSRGKYIQEKKIGVDSMPNMQTAFVRFTSTQNSQSHVAVVYSKITNYNEHKVKDVLSQIKVFDKKGNVLYETSDIHTDCYAPVITSNGRYVLAKTGEDWGEGYVSNAPQGFIICDMKDEKIIYQSSKGNYLGAFVIGDKLLAIADMFNKGFVEYLIFDCDANALFTKRLDYETSSNIVEMDLNGILVDDPKNGKKVLLSYAKDFNNAQIIQK